jgi:hypothetical protein
MAIQSRLQLSAMVQAFAGQQGGSSTSWDSRPSSCISSLMILNYTDWENVEKS